MAGGILSAVNADNGFAYYRLYAVALLGLSIYVASYQALHTSNQHGRQNGQPVEAIWMVDSIDD